MSDTGGSRPDRCRDSCPRVQLFQAVVFVAPVLFTSLLLLAFCLLYIKRRQGASIHSAMRGQIFAGGLLDTSSGDYGLSKSRRQQLPIVPFDEKFLSRRQETQCTVCLGDYQEGEKIQQLPACNHAFHVQCIDKWLATNVTCPICRMSVLPDDKSGPTVNECGQNGEHPVELVNRDEEYGGWEERVISEVQDQSHLIIVESIGGIISDNLRVPEYTAGTQLGGEPAVNLERS